MDQPDAPIIKSGSQHAVQIGEGSKHAKSVRNVVVTEEPKPLADRFVQGEDSTTPPVADRIVAVSEAPEVQDRMAQGEAAAGAQTHRVAVPEEDARAHERILLDPDAQRASPTQGPVVPQHERGLEDARGDKAPTDTEHRVQVPDAGPTQERWLQVAQDRERARALLAQAGVDVAPAAAPAAPAEVLPPEVPAEHDQAQSRAAAAPPSALLARLKAIRSHMAVTETKLDRIEGNEPPSPR